MNDPENDPRAIASHDIRSDPDTVTSRDDALTPDDTRQVMAAPALAIPLDNFLSQEELEDYATSHVAIIHQAGEGHATLVLPSLDDAGNVDPHNEIQMFVPLAALVNFMATAVTTLGLRAPDGPHLIDVQRRPADPFEGADPLANDPIGGGSPEDEALAKLFAAAPPVRG